jgi:DNA-binding transcriptional LysR family regulator
MEMRRLEAFCKVIELKSFTRAATALLVSQPTISEHIRSLEDTLNEKLVDRLGREASPTPAGKIFYQYAKHIIQLRDEAVQALGQFQGNLSGTLLLGASTIPGTYILPRIIGAFKMVHPRIQITLRIADTSDIISDILTGDVEAGIVGSKPADRRLMFQEIYSDELGLIVHPEHKWANRLSIDVTELAHEPFISRERGSGTRMVADKILEQHGIDLNMMNVIAEMGSTEAVREGIKAKIGVSILSKVAVLEDLNRETLLYIPVEKVSFRRPLFLAQRKSRQVSPLCASFLNFLADELTKN